MPDRNVGFFEFNAVQLAGQSHDPVHRSLRRKVLAQFVLVDVIACFLDPLLPVIGIPVLDFRFREKDAALLCLESPQFIQFLFLGRDDDLLDIVQKLVDRPRFFRHPPAQGKIGIAAISGKHGHFMSQIDRFRNSWILAGVPRLMNAKR